MALKFPNVWLGCATWPPRRWPQAFLDFVRGPGRRKVLWGSGFPLVAQAESIAQARALELPEESALLGDNARRQTTARSTEGRFRGNAPSSLTPSAGIGSQALSSASLASVASTSGNVPWWSSACRTTPSGSMMNSVRFANPVSSLKIPNDCATAPCGQKSASSGWRIPPIAIAHVFSENAESTLIPNS